MLDSDVIERILTQLDINPVVSQYQFQAFEGWLDARLDSLIAEGFERSLLFILDQMEYQDVYHVDWLRGKIERAAEPPVLSDRFSRSDHDDHFGSSDRFNRYEEFGYTDARTVMIDGVEVYLE